MAATQADFDALVLRVTQLEAVVVFLRDARQGGGGGKSMLDTKSFQKSDVFSGDKTKYQNWSKKLKAMAAQVHDKGREWLDTSEKSKTALDWELIQGDEVMYKFNNDLYAVLTQLLEGEAMALLAACEIDGDEDGEGAGCNALEAWRQLKRYYDPENESRNLVDLTDVLSQKECRTIIEAKHKLIVWEEQVKKVSKESRDVLHDKIKRSIILSMLPKTERISIERQATSTHMKDFVSIRDDIIRLADIGDQAQVHEEGPW